jgi:hypothetical protein
MTGTEKAVALIAEETEITNDTDFTDGTDFDMNDTMLDSPAIPTVPFYSSYIVFNKAMKVLKSGGLPRRITSATFASLGDDSSRVVRGFWAMGLIDEAGFPTEIFRDLVKAFRTHQWPEALRAVIASSYSYVPLNELGEMTRERLTNIFVAQAGSRPGALQSAETFFLCMASEAGLTMSQELSRRAVRGVTEAHRWLRLDDLEEETVKAETPVPPVENTIADRSKHSDSDPLLEKIGELTALLTTGDMTAEEQKAVVTLLTYFGRKRNSARR